MAQIKRFVQHNTVLLISAIAAIITSCIIKPDAKYISYFDFKTLTCIFCLLAVVCALRNINFFYIMARKIVRLFKTTKICIMVLVCITLIGSLLIANDMALIAFLPLSYYVLNSTKKQKYIAFTFIMQSLAANLGGMLTPLGNPQNLYLYSKYQISNFEFIKIMFPPFFVSIVLITVCCLFVNSEPLEVADETVEFDYKKITLYLALFVLSVAIVFRIIPYFVGLIIIPLTLIYADKKALKMVDYPLILTFVSFFVFSGNMARIETVRNLFAMLLNKSTLFVSVLSCQFISNVPTAILLSQFTNKYADLLVGVNIGGAGTLIASLASLITLREYNKTNSGKCSSFLVLFSILNFSFLIVLTSFMLCF